MEISRRVIREGVAVFFIALGLSDSVNLMCDLNKIKQPFEWQIPFTDFFHAPQRWTFFSPNVPRESIYIGFYCKTSTDLIDLDTNKHFGKSSVRKYFDEPSRLSIFKSTYRGRLFRRSIPDHFSGLMKYLMKTSPNCGGIKIVQFSKFISRGTIPREHILMKAIR